MERLKVFGWANDHHGCGNYRIGLPMWGLAKIGHDATAFSVLNVEIPDDLDVLVGQLMATPDRTRVWQELAQRPDRHFAMVYEIDDDIWNLGMTNPASALSAEWGQFARENIAMADAVTTTNETLAEVVSAYNDNVFVIPNCFDAAILTHQRPVADRLTIGWAGGSSHNRDFQSVQADLKSYFRRNPAVGVHFMGASHAEDVGRPDARFTPWQSNLVEYIHSLDFDIGIAPLAYHAFNRSKSDLKFMEYASLGIPVVASDFGPYASSIQHGLTGFKVKHPHEWAKYLNLLVKDDALRAEISANARAWASTRSVQANVWRWEEVYTKVAGK